VNINHLPIPPPNTRRFRLLPATRVEFGKIVAAGTAFAALAAMIMFIGSPGQAANESQDEKHMIKIGLEQAPVPLNLSNKDPDLVGLGSFLVNVASECNGCHSDPKTSYVGTGNPFFLLPPNGPFSGTRKVDPAYYLGGNRDFGPLGPPPSPNIISRNLTPDKTGMPEGGHTLMEFIQIMRTGVDMDHLHPNCSLGINKNCFPHGTGLPPFDGDLLQIMPWPSYKSMTNHQLHAIYTYLSAIPCLEGGPGEPANRCK
jgi:hypothetical protein